MTKKGFLLIFMAMFGLNVHAHTIDSLSALRLASEFINKKALTRGASVIDQSQLTIARSMLSKKGNPLIHIVNQANGGFIVVAGDDRARTILAYSDSTPYNIKNSNPTVEFLLDSYANQIEKITKSGYEKSTTREFDEQYEDIEPLLKTQWSQHAPYNSLCPKLNKRCPTGCTATAMAQVFYYHQWPEHGMGKHSYIWADRTLSANFGNTTYQWDKMKLSYGDDPDNAVATLMFHCGVAVNMSYHEDGSSAMYNENSIIDFFGYDASTTCGVIGNGSDNSYFTPEDIYADLKQGLPVLLLPSGLEHSFVCDGFSSDGYFHFNLGWGGDSDGYYALGAVHDEWNVVGGFGVFHLQKPLPSFMQRHMTFFPMHDGNATIVETDAEWDGIIPSTISDGSNSYPVNRIGLDAFKGYKGTSVTLPASMTYTRAESYENLTNLKEIKVEEGNPSFKSLNGMLVQEGDIWDKTILVKVPVGFSGVCEVPEGVNTLGSNMLIGCTNITQLILPKSVNKIKENAVTSIWGLRSMLIYADEPPQIESAYIKECIVIPAIYVKPGTLQKYLDDYHWSQYDYLLHEMTDDMTAVKSPQQRLSTNSKQYSLSGRQISKAEKGVQIVVDSEGAKKVVVK